MTAAIARFRTLPALLRLMAAALLLLAGTFGLVTASAGAQAVGERYLVRWSGDQYSYPATIVEVRDGRYFV